MSLKLNLGCGNKLYSAVEGWVNVDVVEPEAVVTKVDSLDSSGIDDVSRPVFHQSLLQNLNFVEDNVADEIHAYHVIEHFYVSEVPEVLKEWKRVLKPNGVIYLEQPDVLKCAANLLLGIVRREPMLINNLGVLGFFGAGTPEEPYMSHKWGWYPDSLGEQLHKAGFTDIVVMSAQTHMKDVRDFRIKGVKPNE